MRQCTVTMKECAFPHLECGACELGRGAGLPADALVRADGELALPNPCPYVRIGSPSGAPGFGIEMGVKGTF